MTPRPLRWGAALAVLGVLERAGLRAVYSPVAFGDTPSYLRLAEALGSAGLEGYDATRVPGYPLFLLALGGEPERIWLAQMALGWGISLLLFWIGWRTTGSARFGFGMGMLYNLIPGLVLFEANLLSETLTMFCVVLSLALLFAAAPSAAGAVRPGAAQHSAAAGQAGGSEPKSSADRLSSPPLPGSSAMRWSTLALLPALGLASAATGLVRALFYPLAPWLTLFVARFQRRWLLPMVLFAVPAALLLGGWVGTVYRQYESLSPTTMSGYHLVQHTGEYFELLPDEHATIRDTYLKYRDARMAERGVQTNAIWDAIPELTEVTGLSFFGLSAELQRLSIQLILAHPGRYLANVVQGWIDFWKAPAIWDPAALQLAALEAVFRLWAQAGRGISLVANGAFLVLSASVVAAFSVTQLGGERSRRTEGKTTVARGTRVPSEKIARRALARLSVDWVFVGSAGLVWWASIVQTLVDHGDNPRFLVPLQIVVIFVVLRAGRSWLLGRRERI